MSLLFRVASVDGPYTGEYPGSTASDVIPSRYMSMATSPGQVVNSESALRHSAVWACLRLRANLISTFPIKCFRKPQFNLPPVLTNTPPIMIAPGGKNVDYVEWMYSTQFDLDRAGNSVGIITELNGYGLPARIKLVPLSWVSCRIIDNEIVKWFIQGREYEPDQIWHEKQYTVAGFQLGLSPIMYAAWSISEYLSIQDFALSWFTSGGIPRSHLRNTNLVTPERSQTDEIKARVKETVATGDVLVTGKDWEYHMVQAEQTGMEWVEARKLGPVDIARFFDVPSDLVDASIPGSNVTYGNVTMRNLQFLTMSLGPAITRRENGLNKLIPTNQYVELDTDSLLRMDHTTRANMINSQIEGRTLTPNEARYIYYNRPPLTEEQYAEFGRFWPTRPAPGTVGIKPPTETVPDDQTDFSRMMMNGHKEYSPAARSNDAG